MKDVTTTRLSSKGQVVIPEAIRRRLGLDPGAEFVVLGDDDTIVLQRVRAPAMQDFDAIVARARGAARGAGMRQSDVAAAIEAVRST